MVQTKSFEKNDYDVNKKIIIYGASVYGELAYKGLELLNIIPDYFCDRARARQSDGYMGVPVIAPEELENYTEDIILIASADFFYEIKDYLDDIGCKNYFNINALLHLPIDRNCISSRANEMLDNRELYSGTIAEVPDKNSIHIVHMGLTVSECCTLKCRDCSFLMQYYQHPRNIDLKKYKYCVDRFLDIIDKITELRPIGGEPFINPDMYKVLDWYHDCKKIGSLDVYTNGTIIPNERTLSSLKYKKVKVHISDYNVVNKERLEKLIEVLEKENIRYSVRKYDIWSVGGNLRKRNFTQKQKEEVFAKCFMTNCYSFLKSRFYGCPRAAHGMNMGAIPDMPYDYVDFADERRSDTELKQMLLDLTKNRKTLASCDYCDGQDNHIEGVMPAIQTLHPLQFD